MKIVLRKLRGRFDAALAYTAAGGPTYTNIARPTSAIAGVLGMIGLAVIAVVMLLTLPHAAHASTHALIGLGFAGTTALKEVQDQMVAKQQKLHEVFEKAGNEMDFSKPDVLTLVGAKDSAEAVEKVRGLNTELDELGKKRDGLVDMDRIREMNAKRRNDPANPITFPNGAEQDPAQKSKAARSIGRIVVESHAFKSWKKHRTPFDSVEDDVAPMEAKAAFTTSAGWAPESLRVPGLVIDKATRPIQVLDLIPSAPTSQAAVVYMEETTRTHSAAERAENAAYAESAFALTQRSETVRLIGDSVPVTDEQMEDVDQVEAYLNQRLGFGVNQRLDNQIINGDGNAPNLTGIANKAGIQTQAKGTDPAQDAFFKAMMNIYVTGRAVPSGHVMHPLDWQGIRLQRTTDGIYIWGSPAEAGPQRMWGLNVALADSLTQGTGITGDFVNFIQLYIKRGVEIAVGYNGSDFTAGRKTVRAGMRVALAIYRAGAFSTVTGL